LAIDHRPQQATPVVTGARAARRVLAISALGIAVAIIAYLLLLRGGSYTVVAAFEDAGQVVTGNQVKVGGVPIGSVEEVRLDDRNRAELVLSIEDSYGALHEGTTATIRSTSLSSLAGRYVALEPGPNSAAEIEDGGTIPPAETTPIGDADAALNALDPQTTGAIEQIIEGSARAAGGRGDEAAAAIHYLNPALSRTSVVLGELASDQRALERLIVETAGVVDTLAGRQRELSVGTGAAAAALSAIASEREALAGSLSAAPPALRQGTTTLAGLRPILADLRPALAEARPVAERLPALLPRLRSVSAGLRSQTPAVRRLVRAPGPHDDATDLLREFPGLREPGVPVFRNLTQVLGRARPVLRELRPYIPELTSGFIAGFGGSSGGYYDANGHYARISFLGGPFSLVGLGSLLPIPSGGIGPAEAHVVARCPGAADDPASDGSSPFTDEGQIGCDPSLVMGGGAR
jgi:phospholipid/cholesterol/gamma-HCH transport system substrate-binding protein